MKSKKLLVAQVSKVEYPPTIPFSEVPKGGKFRLPRDAEHLNLGILVRRDIRCKGYNGNAMTIRGGAVYVGSKVEVEKVL